MPRRKMAIPQLYTFQEVGAALKGFLTSKQQQVIQGKTVGRYIVKAGDDLWVINGTVQLDDSLAQVAVGEWVEIAWTGEQPTSGGYAVRQFDVFVGVEDASDGKK